MSRYGIHIANSDSHHHEVPGKVGNKSTENLVVLN
jgi:hypothetical protein